MSTEVWDLKKVCSNINKSCQIPSWVVYFWVFLTLLWDEVTAGSCQPFSFHEHFLDLSPLALCSCFITSTYPYHIFFVSSFVFGTCQPRSKLYISVSLTKRFNLCTEATAVRKRAFLVADQMSFCSQTPHINPRIVFTLMSEVFKAAFRSTRERLV